MVTVNALGAADPVGMTRAALESGGEEIRALVDDPMRAAEVMRFLEGQGFRVELQDDEGRLTLTGRKGAGAARRAVPLLAAPITTSPRPKGGGVALLIEGRVLGKENPELGEVLMRNLLGTLAKETPPASLILLNEGVRLAQFETSSCDHLKGLEARGTKVLVSRLSVLHLGLSDAIGAGVLADTAEIVRILFSAERVISL